jgi:hypothetical protein
MKVKKEILDKINNPQLRTGIAQKLGCGEQNIALVIRRNHNNGRLTKYDALMAISMTIGVAIGEILEDSIPEKA